MIKNKWTVKIILLVTVILAGLTNIFVVVKRLFVNKYFVL